MKELSIEQKAKVYNEALERAKGVIEQNPLMEYLKKGIEYIFPELKESEDEKIRNFISNELACLRATDGKGSDRYEELTNAIAWLEKQKVLTTEENLQGKKDVLWCIKQAKKYAKDENEMGTCWFAEKWLEKQGEQNPAWGEEDEVMIKVFDSIIRYIVEVVDKDVLERFGTKREELFSWLKSIKERVQTQPKQEWSEEDEHWRQKAIDFMKHPDLIKAVPTLVKDTIDWLKSFRPQTRWKPSCEQIIALRWVLNNIPYNKHKEEISGLLDQIKDL